jgi:hypothetical protein
MASWDEVEAAAPELAAQVRRCFAIRKHATLATLRKDGSPRISGTEVEFGEDGNVYLGMMSGSRKALDLRRDPRLALHCPTEDAPEGDPSAWIGDAKIAGRGVEEPAQGPSGPESGVEGPSGPESGVEGPSGPESGVEGPSGPESGVEGGHRFRIDITEVVHTAVRGDRLVIRSWHPDRGLRTRERQ